MRAPAFWQEDPPGLLGRLLRPLGEIVSAVTAARMRRAGFRAAVPVICVGNFVLGGAGKTPTAIAIARLLRHRGETPVFLTRGYGGSLSSRHPVRVDGQLAREVGDEALLLAAIAPVIVCRDRAAGARAAIAAGASVIVMDDGLQNPSLAKDLTLAVVDGAAGVGNGLTMPAGPLRASLAAQIPHIQAILVIGPGAAGDEIAEAGAAAGKPVLRGRLAPDPAAVALLNDRAVLAFAGIGRPGKFFDTLRETGAQIVATREFPDHHDFSKAEIAALQRDAAAAKAVLVTTEKDRVRLPADLDILTLPVTLDVADDALSIWLDAELARVRRAR